MKSDTETRQRFRKGVESNEPLVAQGAFDCSSAKMIDDVGFPSMWISGHGVSISHLGSPDANLVSMSEHLAVTKNIINTVDTPAIVDCDNGYGDALNVTRTVKEFERAGAAAIVIEDQRIPKRTGLYPGERNLISTEEMVGKLEAAVDAREDDEMMIIARGDGYNAGKDYNEVMERANAYLDTGVDGFLPVTDNFEFVSRIAEEWNRDQALFFLATTFPELTVEEVREHGFDVSIYAIHVLGAALNAMEEFLQDFKEGNSWESYGDDIKYSNIRKFGGEDYVTEMREKYVPD